MPLSRVESVSISASSRSLTNADQASRRTEGDLYPVVRRRSPVLRTEEASQKGDAIRLLGPSGLQPNRTTERGWTCSSSNWCSRTAHERGLILRSPLLAEAAAQVGVPPSGSPPASLL